MEEATGHIELAMEEYNVVTEHFSDIQLIDTAPDNIRRRITETADRVDNLTVDRRIFKSGEHKLSTHTYHRMEQFEDELPRGMKYLEKQESYYETVKRDMKILEGERMSLRMELRHSQRASCVSEALPLPRLSGWHSYLWYFSLTSSVTVRYTKYHALYCRRLSGSGACPWHVCPAKIYGTAGSGDGNQTQ